MRLFGGGARPPRADAGQSTPAEVAAASPRDWAALAMLQPTLGTMPRTVETEGFQADLAAQRFPQQFLAPLSHVVSREAPSGLAHGLATAVQTTTQTMQSPEMPLGSAGRRTAVWRTIMRLGPGSHAQPTVSALTPADAPSSESPVVPSAMPPPEPNVMPEQVVQPEILPAPAPATAVRERPSAGDPKVSLTLARATAVPARVLPVVVQPTVAAPDADEGLPDQAPEAEDLAADSPAVETLGIADEPMTQVGREEGSAHSLEPAPLEAPGAPGAPGPEPLGGTGTAGPLDVDGIEGIAARSPLRSSPPPARRLGLGAPLAEPPPTVLKFSGTPLVQRSAATPSIPPPKATSPALHLAEAGPALQRSVEEGLPPHAPEAVVPPLGMQDVRSLGNPLDLGPVALAPGDEATPPSPVAPLDLQRAPALGEPPLVPPAESPWLPSRDAEVPPREETSRPQVPETAHFHIPETPHSHIPGTPQSRIPEGASVAAPLLGERPLLPEVPSEGAPESSTTLPTAPDSATPVGGVALPLQRSSTPRASATAPEASVSGALPIALLTAPDNAMPVAGVALPLQRSSTPRAPATAPEASVSVPLPIAADPPAIGTPTPRGEPVAAQPLARTVPLLDQRPIQDVRVPSPEPPPVPTGVERVPLQASLPLTLQTKVAEAYRASASSPTEAPAVDVREPSAGLAQIAEPVATAGLLGERPMGGWLERSFDAAGESASVDEPTNAQNPQEQALPVGRVSQVPSGESFPPKTVEARYGGDVTGPTIATPLQRSVPASLPVPGPPSTLTSQGAAATSDVVRTTGPLSSPQPAHTWAFPQGNSRSFLADDNVALPTEWPGPSSADPLSMPLSPPASDPGGLSIQTFPAAHADPFTGSMPQPQAPLPQSWPPPDLPPVQRELEAVAPPVEAAQPPPATEPAPAPAAVAGGAGGGTQDLDDLAQRLYPKIRPYLKRELWLDRERAGSLTGLS
jgi:hypothetical protein